MPDIEDLHAGLEAYLRADPALVTAAPGGIWFDLAPQKAAGVFIVVRVQAGTRDTTHDRAGYEAVRYSITAVGQTTQGLAVVDAAKRIRARLEGQVFPMFPVAGYQVIRCAIDTAFGPVAFVQPDGELRWQHRGRIWDVWVAPLN